MVPPIPTFPSVAARHPVAGYPSTGLYTQGSIPMGVPYQPTPYVMPYHSQSQTVGKIDSVDSALCGVPQKHFVEYRERIVEVPEVQIIEKLVEVVQKYQQEKLVHVPKIEVVERKVPVPKVVLQEKVVHVPQIQYKEVAVEKVVEVPEIQTQVVVKEVDVPVNVTCPVIQPRQNPVEQTIQRNIPVPIELTTIQGYEIPKLKPKYKEIPVPIYVPRYIEMPIPIQVAQAYQQQTQETSRLGTQLSMTPPTAMSTMPTQTMVMSMNNPAMTSFSQPMSRRVSGAPQMRIASRNVSGMAMSQNGGATPPVASAPVSREISAVQQPVVVA